MWPGRTLTFDCGEFISCYAKMNVVKNRSFLQKWSLYVESQSFENTIGLYSIKGDSRDDPTGLLSEDARLPVSDH
jgi:hypothetical protein